MTLLYPQHARVPLLTRLWSFTLTIVWFLTTENLLWWRYTRGKKHPQADQIGPAYIVGSPDRMIAEGKAILASHEILQRCDPFLLTLRVVDPQGRPLRKAALDLWQADGDGSYVVASYDLRGKVTTDEQGRVEVLTVIPGDYGPKGYHRAGHIHLCLSPSSTDQTKAFEGLTSQLYVCKDNDPAGMGYDLFNWFRPTPYQNMLQCWSGEHAHSLMGFPAINDEEVGKRQCWWNERLAEHDMHIVAGAQFEFVLYPKV